MNFINLFIFICFVCLYSVGSEKQITGICCFADKDLLLNPWKTIICFTTAPSVLPFPLRICPLAPPLSNPCPWVQRSSRSWWLGLPHPLQPRSMSLSHWKTWHSFVNLCSLCPCWKYSVLNWARSLHKIRQKPTLLCHLSWMTLTCHAIKKGGIFFFFVI